MSKVHEVVTVENGKIIHKYEKTNSSGCGGGSTTEDIVLSENLTFTASVGGVDANTTFSEGTSLSTVLKRIGSKAILHSVSLTSNLSTLVYEIGTVLSKEVTLTAKVTRGTAAITKVEFLKNSSTLSSITSDVSAGGDFKCTDKSTISSNVDYKVVVTNSDGKSVEATLGIKFYSPFYYGVTSTVLKDIQESDVKSLSKDVSAKGKKKYSYTSDNQYCLFAYPKKYGLLTSILDSNNFENVESMDYTEVTVGGIPYYVYQTQTPVICSGFTYTFIF